MWHGNALIMNNKHQLSIPSKASNLSPSLSIMSRDFSCSNNIVRKNVKVPESSALLITEERYIYIYIYIYIDALYHPTSMVGMETGGCDITAYPYTQT